ncbi:recombinase family protein [Aestuariispira insulae]|uniref:DNA invertase Pin-like site-specific DNA recombinase n=1 Tax=Aestuariispira insulae TaxID=1461337 RepID=A0A3D9H3N9_9PROT|nr:recombinase family protein [Aestuariispira insulae]RED44100.1 DNA invertase Pin-like site-specific DNA recombinase [Aestuariispira insulae]
MAVPVEKIGYARVSSSDQRLELQIDALKKAGVKEKFLFTDHASGSGLAFKREGLLTALKLLCEGDTFVVWKLDRLGRSVSELIKTLEIIRNKGANLQVLTQPIDTTTSHGKLFFHMVAAFAEFERDLIAERTRDGLAAAKRRGVSLGQKKKLTPAMLQKVVDLRRQGKSYVEIASTLSKNSKTKVSKSTLYSYKEQIEAMLPFDLEEVETDSN